VSGKPWPVKLEACKVVTVLRKLINLTAHRQTKTENSFVWE